MTARIKRPAPKMAHTVNVKRDFRVSARGLWLAYCTTFQCPFHVQGVGEPVARAAAMGHERETS